MKYGSCLEIVMSNYLFKQEVFWEEEGQSLRASNQLNFQYFWCKWCNYWAIFKMKADLFLLVCVLKKKILVLFVFLFFSFLPSFVNNISIIICKKNIYIWNKTKIHFPVLSQCVMYTTVHGQWKLFDTSKTMRLFLTLPKVTHFIV